MNKARKRSGEYRRRFRLVADTKVKAVKETKRAIRRAVAQKPWPRWHLLTFTGRHKSESRGVVDLVAIRKNHALPFDETKRGDTFQIFLIQIKGGYASRPRWGDIKRLRAVARHHRARGILLAEWKKNSAPRFYSLGKYWWDEVTDLRTIFY